MSYKKSTPTALAALREVVEQRGIFCALYTDRGSHFRLTPKAGEIVDRQRMTQIGRAMRELDIEMIPAYSPQARGRSERNFGTWQGRLPQELRVRGITTVEEANRFLRESYIAELNRKFSVPAAQPESAFVPVSTWTAPGACSTDRTWLAAMPRTAHTMGAPNRLFRREAKAI